MIKLYFVTKSQDGLKIIYQKWDLDNFLCHLNVRMIMMYIYVVPE